MVRNREVELAQERWKSSESKYSPQSEPQSEPLFSFPELYGNRRLLNFISRSTYRRQQPPLRNRISPQFNRLYCNHHQLFFSVFFANAIIICEPDTGEVIGVFESIQPSDNFATGCIFEYDEAHPEGSVIWFKEEDTPNFTSDSTENCLLNVYRCLVVFLLGTPDSTTNPNQRCHLLPSPPSWPEPHPTTAAIPIPGLSCSCGTTDLHLSPFSIAAGVGSSTIADAVGEENRRPSPPNLHHPLVYSSGDQGAANQFHRHLPPSLSVSLSLPDSCCQRRKAAFTIELEASPSLKNTSTTVASPTRLHLSNRTADLLFFPSSEIGPGRGVDRVPSLVPDSNRFHAC
ncbi:hypothetical protein LXL04_028503 [Taraxacum kok-saghyz]